MSLTHPPAPPSIGQTPLSEASTLVWIKPFDILLLGTLAVLWGSAFMFMKIAVNTIPPLSVAAGRVVIGAALVALCLVIMRRKLPRSRRTWVWCIIGGISGAALPFFLIAWGQQTVSSALTAIAMASVPLFTLPLAHLLTTDEKLTGGKILGVAIGFSGVALLFLGDGADGSAGFNILGLVAILGGALAYACQGMIIRHMRAIDGIALSTAILLAGAAILVPVSLIVDRPWALEPAPESLVALLILGIFPTALAMVVVVILIGRVGATAASLNNYLVPVVGVICGVLWMSETLSPFAIGGFLLIVAGVYTTTRKSTATSAPKSF